MKRLAVAFAVVTVVFVGLFFGVAALMPRTWNVEAAVTIAAPPSAVYPRVAQLQRWPEWMPWTKEADPTMKLTFEGTDGAPGARMNWAGDKTSEGWLRITAVEPERRMEYELASTQMTTPAQGSIGLEPTADGARVTWSTRGEVDTLIGRYFAPLFADMMRNDFEKGLANLKSAVESQPQ